MREEVLGAAWASCRAAIWATSGALSGLARSTEATASSGAWVATVTAGAGSAGGVMGFIAIAGAAKAASAMAKQKRVPRWEGRAAVCRWGRVAVVTRSSRFETSGDYARQSQVKGSKNVSWTQMNATSGHKNGRDAYSFS